MQPGWSLASNLKKANEKTGEFIQPNSKSLIDFINEKGGRSKISGVRDIKIRIK